MLPNRFPDAGTAPEFNAVDASLWFVVAAGELLEAAATRPRLVSKAQRRRLQEAIAAILEGYAAGTRYGIRMDTDGLLAAGEPGQQLTWMDARVDGREITPTNRQARGGRGAVAERAAHGRHVRRALGGSR